MHTILLTDKELHSDAREKFIVESVSSYNRTCYVSIDDPYHIVVEILKKANVETEKFIIIDASGNIKEPESISRETYVLPAADLFEIHLILKNLIKDEKIELLFLDSLSALIDNYEGLPLKETLTNILLEIGSLRCSSILVVFNYHANHEVVSHLSPMIGRRHIF